MDVVLADGVRHYVGHVHSWTSQAQFTITAAHAGRDAAVAEWMMRGVQDRPIPGRVPAATNRAVGLKSATVLQLHGGRIVRAADYIDVLGSGASTPLFPLAVRALR